MQTEPISKITNEKKDKALVPKKQHDLKKKLHQGFKLPDWSSVLLQNIFVLNDATPAWLFKYQMNKILLKTPNTFSFLSSPQGESPHIVYS